MTFRRIEDMDSVTYAAVQESMVMMVVSKAGVLFRTNIGITDGLVNDVGRALIEDVFGHAKIYYQGWTDPELLVHAIGSIAIEAAAIQLDLDHGELLSFGMVDVLHDEVVSLALVELLWYT